MNWWFAHFTNWTGSWWYGAMWPDLWPACTHKHTTIVTQSLHRVKWRRCAVFAANSSFEQQLAVPTDVVFLTCFWRLVEARANHALTIGAPDMFWSEVILGFFGYELKLLHLLIVYVEFVLATMLLIDHFTIWGIWGELFLHFSNHHHNQT